MLQQKLAKRDGAPIDRSRDVEHLWNFYLSYKRQHRVDDIQREEQKWRETGTFSSNLGEYDQLVLLYEFPYNLFVCCSILCCSMSSLPILLSVCANSRCTNIDASLHNFSEWMRNENSFLLYHIWLQQLEIYSRELITLKFWSVAMLI